MVFSLVERDGMWLSAHIKELLSERDAKNVNGNGTAKNGEHVVNVNGFKKKGSNGVSSRELSGEMGGDTTSVSA